MSKRTLMVELRVGEVLNFACPDGSTVVVKLESKTGSRARIRIDAESTVRIDRPKIEDRAPRFAAAS